MEIIEAWSPLPITERRIAGVLAQIFHLSIFRSHNPLIRLHSLTSDVFLYWTRAGSILSSLKRSPRLRSGECGG